MQFGCGALSFIVLRKKPVFPYNKDLFAITTKLLVVNEMVPPTNVSFPIIK